MNQCHKCKYNRKHDSHCLKCQMPEEYQYKYQKYILDTYDPVQPDNSGSD